MCEGVPIIVLSASHQAGEAMQLGATDFLDKPFDVDVLLQTVQDALR